MSSSGLNRGERGAFGYSRYAIQMGLILDSDVLGAEPIDSRKWSHHGEAISLTNDEKPSVQ